jgi:hypothetical protein
VHGTTPCENLNLTVTVVAMDHVKRSSRALRAWCAVSDTIGADITGGAAVVIVMLVGLGAMHPLALGGSGALASLAAVLYRRRPISDLDRGR